MRASMMWWVSIFGHSNGYVQPQSGKSFHRNRTQGSMRCWMQMTVGVLNMATKFCALVFDHRRHQSLSWGLFGRITQAQNPILRSATSPHSKSYKARQVRLPVHRRDTFCGPKARSRIDTIVIPTHHLVHLIANYRNGIHLALTTGRDAEALGYVCSEATT